MGDYTRAEARCAEAVALGRQRADGEPLVVALLMQGQVALGQADYARAAELLEEGLRIARHEEDAAAWIPHTLQNLARAFMGLGDLDRATALGEEARALFHQRRDSHGLENVDRVQMRIARLRGNVRQGAVLIRENLAVNRDLGAGGNLASGFESEAWIARVNREYARSARLLGAADALRESLQRPIQAEVRRERDEDLAIVREALGPDAFEAAWAEGRAMELDHAIAYALERSTPT
jgi:tetratricopeptide (TPR) repeat protein